MPDPIDLWPKDLPTGGVLTPLAVLKTQAAYLTTRMKGLVQGKVTTQRETDEREREAIRHEFRMVVPALGMYEYTLFAVQHDPVLFYPMTVYWNGPNISCSDQSALESALRKIFTDEHTRSALLSFVSQSHDSALSPRRSPPVASGASGVSESDVPF